MTNNRTPHMNRGALLLLAVATLFMLDAHWAFGQSQVPNPAKEAKTYAALAKVPQKARTRSNPLESDPDAVMAGGKLFEQHCAECHGKKAEGGPKGASLLRPQVAQATPGALFWILTNGVVGRGMPVWSKLPEPQRWQIITFLKSFNTSASD
jgi:mono/diheme cytochrome c family protein